MSKQALCLLQRPYCNISITEQSDELMGGPGPDKEVFCFLTLCARRSETNELAIYPYRVVGSDLRKS